MKKLLLVAVFVAATLLLAAIVPALRCPVASETISPVANDLPLSVIRSLQHDSHAITDSVVTITNDPTDLKYTRTLVTREITLTKAQPSDSFLGATLIAVAHDGTTTLQVSKTQHTLKARVGDYFASQEYGRAGFRLVSASGERQEVLLKRTWCE